MTLLLLENSLWAAFAAMGFAILFNVPVRALPFTAFAGAIGYAVRSTLVQIGISIEWGTLVGATVVGFMGWLFARRQQMPRAVYTIAGIIPMVPGVFAYQTLIALFQIAEQGSDTPPDLLLLASVNGIKTGFILAALASGISIPRMLFHKYNSVI